MQAYSPSFARIYNLRWAQFSRQTAPRLQAFYESTPLGQSDHTLLDVCCGTGHLALHFLDLGYRVSGLDLSEAMLKYARENSAPYLITGQARFFQADAAHFEVEERFGLAVSTFDALNHLPDLDALSGCFRSVWKALKENGIFIFDLNTREGLRRWTSISVEDTEELMLITRGLFDANQGRAYTFISGFVRVAENSYERFEETAYNTAFDLSSVHEALLDSGFRAARFCRLQDLHTPLEEPEHESRVFIVAEK